MAVYKLGLITPCTKTPQPLLTVMMLKREQKVNKLASQRKQRLTDILGCDSRDSLIKNTVDSSNLVRH